MADKKTLQIAPLPFGIPQLDQLLGYPDLESVESKDTIGCMETTTSLAIVGQDGTGKSIFALHLASAYRAILRYVNHKGAGNHASPFVFYVSSDLGFNAANRVWENFYLDYPWHRYVPFTSANDIEYRRETLRAKGNLFRVNLRRCSPEKYSAAASASAPADEAFMQLGDHLRQLRRGRSSDADHAEVAFIDLESQTTGDDWLFVSRLLTSVPRLRMLRRTC